MQCGNDQITNEREKHNRREVNRPERDLGEWKALLSVERRSDCVYQRCCCDTCVCRVPFNEKNWMTIL